MEFPIIDLGAADDGVAGGSIAGRIDDACRNIGFLAVVNHGVPDEIIEHAWDAARRFFDLPLDQKLELASDDPAYPYGYVGMELEALAASAGGSAPAHAAPDLKETFNLAPPVRPEVERLGGPRQLGPIWPTEPPDFRPAWETYYAHMEALASRLMSLSAVALGLDPDFFADKIDRHVSALRALNYPPQAQHPVPGQIRAGAHTDYGTLTILKPGSGTGGLEVLLESGSWLPVPQVEGAFVINIGDLMARWTNDRWRSTVHRVVNPDAVAASRERRQSMAFFHQPNWDAEVACLPTCVSADAPARYEPTYSGDWLLEKVRAAFDQ